MNEAITFFAALIGGIGPVLLWLWFWLREDAKHPEPRRLIALAFLGGMIAVALVIPIEQYVAEYVSNQTYLFIAWAAIEELTKLLLAWITVLRLRDNDEPIDSVVYMITVALGFAGLENALFLWNPSLSGHALFQVILTGDYRFVGADLLHVLASATIGVSLALSFNKPLRTKVVYLACGVILAIVLHSLFNILIINTAPADMLRTFSFVWVGLVALLAVLELVKRIPYRRRML